MAQADAVVIIVFISAEC